MEPSKEPISVRVTRLNNQLLSKCASPTGAKRLATREGLLDAVTVLYDECNNDNLKRADKNIGLFIDKFRSTVSELKQLRVNISDFEVKTVIGRGHFGEVHVVREKQTGDVYAMKTLRKLDTLNQQAVSFYEEERDIMASATSPWLTHLQYAFQDYAHLYLIMEFHPGGDLLALLERHNGSLSHDHAQFYLAELSLALHALHSMGYVHRDIKPDNVLLDRCGHLKLADFGSAAKLSSTGFVTSKMPVGTPEYIAPEVLKSMENDTGLYGIECDYWSLGVVAYEMAVGSTPFADKAVSSVYNNIMNYTSKLKFPPDCLIAEPYKKFICSLLTDANSRLSHKQVLGHSFFKDVNWNGLREQLPPFVPRINSVDDTSNFIEFERKSHVPSLENLKARTQFSGRNLPFIGFTYTQEMGLAQDLDSSIRSVTDRKQKIILDEKKRELEDLHRRLAHIEGGNKEVPALRKRLAEQIHQMKLSEASREKLERDLIARDKQIFNFKRTLEAERRERKELEERALVLIKSTKQKWEAEERERVSQLMEEIDQRTQRETDLCTANNELTSKLERCQNELTNAREELEQLRSVQEEYKESMNKARDLNRRSVAGVNSRLEKIKSETTDYIEELQQKLQKEHNIRNDLENELRHSKNVETKLCGELDITVKEKLELKEKLHEIEEKCKDYDNLESELKFVKQELQVIRNDKEKQIDECKKLLKQNSTVFENTVDSLKAELEAAREALEKEQNSKKAIEADTKSVIERFEDQLKQVLEDREILQKKLSEVRESDELNRSKVNDLEELLARLENGVTRLEAQDSQEELVAKLESQIKTLQESIAFEKQEARSAKRALWKKEKELSDCDLDKRIAMRELKSSEEKIKSLTERVENLTKQLESTKTEQDNVVANFNSKNKDLTSEVEKLNAEINQLKDSFECSKGKWKREKTIYEQNLNELKKTNSCIDKIKDEIKEMEHKCTVLKTQLNCANDEKRLLTVNVEKSNCEISRLESILDQRNRDLENVQFNFNTLKGTCSMLEGQLEDYQRLLSVQESKQLCLNNEKIDLCNRLEQIQDELKEANKAINEEKSLRLMAEKRIERLTSEIADVKEDSQNMAAHLLGYKNLSTKLQEDVLNSEDRVQELNETIKSLEKQLITAREEETFVKEESSKHLTMLYKIKQSNMKLSDEMEDCKAEVTVLQDQVNDLANKLCEQAIYYQQRELKSEATQQQQTKLIDYLQSSLEAAKKKKTFTEKVFGSSKKENLPPYIEKNLEAKLEEERMKCKALSIELRTVRAELTALKFKPDSLSRMEQTVERRSSREFCRNVTPLMKGWVKISSDPKFSWERKYLLLEDTKLIILENKDDTVGTTLQLVCDGATTRLTTDLSKSECGKTAKTDLPFILKLDLMPDTTCWPHAELYIMCLSDETKQQWIRALRTVIPQTADEYVGELFFECESDMDLNCCLEMDRITLLVGTEKGVVSVTKADTDSAFAFGKRNAVLFDGVTHVYQISLFTELKCIVMIAGPSRQLLKSHIPHVLSISRSKACSNPTLRTQLISDDTFHLFETSQTDMMCAATQTKIVILKYNIGLDNFVPVRMLDTAEPCSCMLFRPHSLIVGANKFFEIDLRDFMAEEFLDASDSTLGHVACCYKLRSFPIALIDVGRSTTEYLLCYNEFGVFVDEFGRRSRKQDLKWSHLPLTINYHKPYLFNVQFSAIEIIKIPMEEGDIPSARLELKNVKYLGQSREKATIYVLYQNEIRLIQGNKFYEDVALEDLETDDDESNGGFSFTSSMVESLDRDVTTDVETDSTSGQDARHVKFTKNT